VCILKFIIKNFSVDQENMSIKSLVFNRSWQNSCYFLQHVIKIHFTLVLLLRSKKPLARFCVAKILSRVGRSRSMTAPQYECDIRCSYSQSVRRCIVEVVWRVVKHELFWNLRNFDLMLTHPGSSRCNANGKSNVFYHTKLKESVHK